MTMVSVIIPVYKVERTYFDQCINSVLAQTYMDIEIILVDDGAAGDLPAACDDYALMDKRIRVLHQENAGASAARNAGLAAATGEYVTFVDSDDWIDSSTIETALNRIQENDLQVLLWGSYKCYEQRREEYMPYTEDIALFSEKQKEQLMLKTMVGHLPFYEKPASHYGSGSCCSKMYRRSFLKENELWYPVGIQRAEDVNFNIRVFDKASRIGYMNRHLYYYRQLPDSATYQYREHGIEVFTRALGGLEAFLKDTGKGELFWQVYYMRCVFFFLESIDMDYMNSSNTKKFGRKMAEMRAEISKDPYRSAVIKLRMKHLSLAKRIPLFLMRRKWMGMLCLMYKAYSGRK